MLAAATTGIEPQTKAGRVRLSGRRAIDDVLSCCSPPSRWPWRRPAGRHPRGSPTRPAARHSAAAAAHWPSERAGDDACCDGAQQPTAGAICCEARAPAGPRRRGPPRSLALAPCSPCSFHSHSPSPSVTVPQHGHHYPGAVWVLRAAFRRVGAKVYGRHTSKAFAAVPPTPRGAWPRAFPLLFVLRLSFALFRDNVSVLLFPS